MNRYPGTGDPFSGLGIIQGGPPTGLVNLGPGYLDPVLVPTRLIAQWSADALGRWGPHALAYGANAGPWPLRAKLAARVAGPAGRCLPRQCQPEMGQPEMGQPEMSQPEMARLGPANVLITGGTSAALDQLAMRFTRQGRVVLTESLTYDFGRAIFTGWGVRTVAVPGPVDDLDVSRLRRAARLAARSSGLPPVIYLIPTYHNPTGRVLSAERRLEILALAEETGALLVEDHAYAELGYTAPAPPPLWAQAADPERVIALYSLSKCLAPGLRLGWLVGGERLVAELAASPVRVSGGGPNHLTALVLLAGLLGDQLDPHVSTLREQLRLRRDSLLDPLLAGLPDGYAVTRPAGGFFAWVRLPSGVTDELLLRAAQQRGVTFAAGRRFGAAPGGATYGATYGTTDGATDGAASGARLCFAGCAPDQLSRGAALFLAACRSAIRA